MRIRVRHVVYLAAVGVLAGCSAGRPSSTTSHPGTTSSGSAATAARATVTPPATAGPRLPLLGVLPVPADATPWPTNTNAQLSRTTYVESNYPKKDWATEEGEMASRRFVAAVQKGWDNPDGSQQSIEIVRFAGEDGATSAWDEVTAGYETQYPHSLLTDSATGAVGYSSPTLDSQGYAVSEWAVSVGDWLAFADEYTAATPDPAAAKALLAQQYDRLTAVS